MPVTCGDSARPRTCSFESTASLPNSFRRISKRSELNLHFELADTQFVRAEAAAQLQRASVAVLQVKAIDDDPVGRQR